MAFGAAHHAFAAIYSSDLIRTRETARALAERCGLEARPLPQLRERHFGIFQGITVAEAAQRYPGAYARYKARDLDYDFEIGESLHALAARVEDAVAEMTRRHPNQAIAAITHVGVLDILYRRATGRPLHTPRDFAVPNCALNWLRFDGRDWGAGGWQLEMWDDHRYLSDVLRESVE